MEIRRLAIAVFLAAGCSAAQAQQSSATGGTSGTSATGGSTQSTSGTGGSSSGASSFVSVNCDKASTATLGTVSAVTRYADLPVTGLDPTSPPAVRAIECTDDLVVQTSGTGGATGYTYSGDPNPAAAGNCFSDDTFWYAPGHIYIWCGSGTSYYSRVLVAMP